MRDTVILEKGPTRWGAYVPDLPGCVAAGEGQGPGVGPRQHLGVSSERLVFGMLISA
jgi:hypothetical protein